MATKKKMLDYILSKIEIERPGYITYTKKFGKYVITFDNEIFIRVFDKTLYLVATEPGRVFLGKPLRAVPFKNAKPHFVISEEQYEDSEWFSELVDITIDAIISPKMPRKQRRLERLGLDTSEVTEESADPDNKDNIQ